MEKSNSNSLLVMEKTDKINKHKQHCDTKRTMPVIRLFVTNEYKMQERKIIKSSLAHLYSCYSLSMTYLVI
jgi:hypothetical protein